jgi:hypothetical protein
VSVWPGAGVRRGASAEADAGTKTQLSRSIPVRSAAYRWNMGLFFGFKLLFFSGASESSNKHKSNFEAAFYKYSVKDFLILEKIMLSIICVVSFNLKSQFRNITRFFFTLTKQDCIKTCSF